MAISVFLSTVSDEFRSYRELLVHDLTRQNVAIKVQEDFKELGGTTLEKLDTYIAACDAVVHLVGNMCGSAADAGQQLSLLSKYSDLAGKLSPLAEALRTGIVVSYTQWEAWLALYHGKHLYVATADKDAPRGPNYAPTEASREAQQAHLARLKEVHRYPFRFTSPDNLAKLVFASGILDLLVKDYAAEIARGRAVAEGFIGEMAKRVAGDKALDFDGMKQAVQKAIEIYEREIAGRPVETNLDDIVSRALTRAKAQVDTGKSGLARATLRRAAEKMRHEEEERRERFVAGVTTLYTQVRDIALATYDGEAAADAVIALVNDIHGSNPTKVTEFLSSEAEALYEHGRDRGSNVHLVSAIALRRELLRLAVSDDERGTAGNDLGVCLWSLGERESATGKLGEAVAAYRVALKERNRERFPLDWATTQNNLGNALFRLGERESGTARLEESVEAYRAALEEWTREGVPLDWAIAQNNLGAALAALGERESGTARLEEAVEAYRAALEEGTRDRDPLLWATTQNNLGDALETLGERESGTVRLEEAVAAYRAALEEWKREQVPLDWALAQNNLGYALAKLGERERGIARLEEAVAAYGAALDEFPRERVPLDWAESFGGQGIALMLIADRTNNGVMAEAAVRQIQAAYETARSGDDEQSAADFQAELAEALKIRNRLQGK